MKEKIIATAVIVTYAALFTACANVITTHIVDGILKGLEKNSYNEVTEEES